MAVVEAGSCHSSGPQAWEPPYAAGAALKKKRKKEQACLHRLLGLNFLSLAIRMSFYFQRPGGPLSHERFIFCFQRDREEGQRVPLALAVSEVPLVQNHQCAIMVYLGQPTPNPSTCPPAFLSLIFHKGPQMSLPTQLLTLSGRGFSETHT